MNHEISQRRKANIASLIYSLYHCCYIFTNNARVGTPTPQQKTLIVDTESHHTAFPCKGCTDCGEEHHTDSYFDPDQSNSLRYHLF